MSSRTQWTVRSTEKSVIHAGLLYLQVKCVSLHVLAFCFQGHLRVLQMPTVNIGARVQEMVHFMFVRVPVRFFPFVCFVFDYYGCFCTDAFLCDIQAHLRKLIQTSSHFLMSIMFTCRILTMDQGFQVPNCVVKMIYFNNQSFRILMYL